QIKNKNRTYGEDETIPWLGGASSKAKLGRRAKAFNPLPQRLGGVDAGERLERDGAGRRGHIDLGQVVADHVDADEQQPAGLQLRADGGADLAVAGGQLDGLGAPADRQVRADLTR